MSWWPTPVVSWGQNRVSSDNKKMLRLIQSSSSGWVILLQSGQLTVLLFNESWSTLHISTDGFTIIHSFIHSESMWMCERRESNQSSARVCSWSSTRLCRRCTPWVTVCPWSPSLPGAPSSVCSGNNTHQLTLQITLSTLSYLHWYEWTLLQEAPLHQELHPPQPLPVLHPASCGCAGQRWHTLQSNVPVL